MCGWQTGQQVVGWLLARAVYQLLGTGTAKAKANSSAVLQTCSGGGGCKSRSGGVCYVGVEGWRVLTRGNCCAAVSGWATWPQPLASLALQVGLGERGPLGAHSACLKRLASSVQRSRKDGPRVLILAAMRLHHHDQDLHPSVCTYICSINMQQAQAQAPAPAPRTLKSNATATWWCGCPEGTRYKVPRYRVRSAVPLKLSIMSSVAGNTLSHLTQNPREMELRLCCTSRSASAFHP
jgi:hypothetical protein